MLCFLYNLIIIEDAKENGMKNSELKVRLKEAMESKGLSQAMLSRMTGISRATICNYLGGHHDAKMETLMKLSKALNVSEMWLAGYDCPVERVNDSMKTLSDEEQRVVIAYRLNPEFQSAVKRLLGVEE